MSISKPETATVTTKRTRTTTTRGKTATATAAETTTSNSAKAASTTKTTTTTIKLHSHQIKTVFVTNLYQSVTVDDLYELFGLRSTSYLRNNCHIEMDHFSNVD